jgi:AraC-like DNA-binding protein
MAQFRRQQINLDYIPQRTRFKEWQEMAAELYVPVGLTCDFPDTFRFVSDMQCIGNIGAGTSLMTPLQVDRSQQHIRRSESDDLKLVVPTSGQIVVRQDRREVKVATGGFYVCDPVRPYQEEILEDLHFVWLMLPRAAVISKVPALEKLTATEFRCEQGPFAKLFRDYVLNFSSVWCDMDGVGATQASIVAQDLFTMALWERLRVAKTHSSEHRSAQFYRAKAILDARLADPELDMAQVASLIGVSTRYLRSLFSEIGLSFRSYIHNQRLERCSNALSDPRFNTKTITEIAFMNGFDNPAYFSRSFREKFGVSPRDFRAERLGL